MKPHSFCPPSLLLLSMAFLIACQSNTSTEEPAPPGEEEKKVQALLLTQNFDYNNADKNRITGAYIPQQRLEVPQNLEPQNKWVMFEGPVLENDLIAYRFYMDSRHRTDIYGKRVKDLVMDTVSWQYHDIMDWGSDILKVNQSLGIGSPAIWYQDSLFTLSNCEKKVVEIHSQDAESATIRTTFSGLKIMDHQFDLVQDWSIRAGEAWTTIQLEVQNGSLPQGMYFATGFVKHLDALQSGEAANCRYAFTWGEQSFHHENMGMGVVMKLEDEPELLPNAWSHAYVFKNAPQKLRYRFLAAWERDVIGVQQAGDFKNLMIQACEPMQ